MKGRHRGSVARLLQYLMPAIHQRSVSVDWLKVFKTSFMLLFVAYPGVALKIMRMFHCVDVEGVSWLAADMRLRCYDAEWWG